MSQNTHKDYLIIADISGYTSYVAKTELEHSQEVLADLAVIWLPLLRG